MWKSKYFMLGKTIWTQAVNWQIANNGKFAREICDIMNRYCNKDFGDISEKDNQANHHAITCNERVLAAYGTSQGKIYVITEWDRSSTTILFASEY